MEATAADNDIYHPQRTRNNVKNGQGQLTLVAGVLAKLSRRIIGWNCMVLKYFRWMRAVRRTCRGNGAVKNATTESA